MGYSMDKSRSTIDIFVNYVLSNLKMRGGIDSNFKLLSGKNLITYDDEGNETIRKERKHKVIRGDYSHKQILASLYKELILNEGYAEAEGYTETANPILPPLFVDRFVSDFDRIVKFTDYWRNIELNEEDKTALKNALLETEREVEKYQKKFDFDNALKFYKRLNSAAAELADSEKLSAGFLLKQVKIYFHLEDYDKCRELIETNLKKYENFRLNNEVGEFYYYLGMMSSYSNKIKDADNYFARSSRMLTATTESGKANLYYRSRIRRYILKKDYDHAIVLVNESIRHAFKHNDIKELSYTYGLKAEIYVRNEKYDLALDNLNTQLEYARKTNDMITESSCIVQMFLVFSYFGNIDENKAKEYLRRIKKLSKIIKRPTNYYDALIGLAIHYYRNNKENESEKYFKKASAIYTIKTTDAASHVVNMIYLSKIKVNKKNYYGASMLLHKMLKLCESRSVSIYPSYIYNSLGKIYFEQHKFKKSNLYLGKAIKLIQKDTINDPKLKANCYLYLGTNNYNINKSSVALKYLNTSSELFKKINRTENDAEIEETINSIDSMIKEITN